MSKRVWFVVPLDAGWIVRERTEAQGEILPSKEAAVARAKALATAAAPARYVVRRADGSIASEHSVPRAQSGVIAAVSDAEIEGADEKAG